MSMSRNWLSLLATIFLALSILWLAEANLHAPKGASSAQFSGGRAVKTLTHLLEEQVPHPSGSQANGVIRDRIVNLLAGYGYQVEIQKALQCETEGRSPGCTQVENILTKHAGTGNGKAVLVTAHYDSVPAGPGVADDGVGTAVVLELARAFIGRNTKNDIIFLITDGEETGLRGAYAFAKRHPWMKDVGVVVNIEARGTSGPSMMFETGIGNSRLIEVYQSSVAHPVATSLIYEVYKLLPNDTDFSVYRKMGLTGFNFANSNSASLYHSLSDDLKHVSPETIEHHIENAWQVTVALSDADLSDIKSDQDATYFDVFSEFLIVWPSFLNLPLSIVLLFAVIILGARELVNASITPTGRAIAGLAAAPLLLFVFGWLLSFPLGLWPGGHPLDHTSPWLPRLALLFAACGAALIVSVIVGQTSLSLFKWFAWIILAGLGLAVAVYVPGVSFLFLLPVGAFVLTAALNRLGVDLPNANVAGAVALAMLWVPYLSFLELVLPFNASQWKLLILVPAVWVVAPLLSFASMAPPIAAMFALAGLFAGLSWVQSPFSNEVPRGHNIVYYDDKSQKPQWFVSFVGSADQEFISSQKFPKVEQTIMQLGVFPVPGYVKPAQDRQLLAPEFKLLSREIQGAQTKITGYILNARAGLQSGLAIQPGSAIQSIRVGDLLEKPAETVSINQDWIGPSNLSGNKPVLARIDGQGSKILPVEFVLSAKGHTKVKLFERSALPESAETDALLKARAPISAPVHLGDGALVASEIDLGEIAIKP